MARNAKRERLPEAEVQRGRRHRQGGEAPGAATEPVHPGHAREERGRHGTHDASVLADPPRMLDMIARFGNIRPRTMEYGVVELRFTARPTP